MKTETEYIQLLKDGKIDYFTAANLKEYEMAMDYLDEMKINKLFYVGINESVNYGACRHTLKERIKLLQNISTEQIKEDNYNNNENNILGELDNIMKDTK